MKIFFVLALGLTSCATFDSDLKAFVNDPNVAHAVQGLIGAATDHLDQAIDMAENNALRVWTIGKDDIMQADLHAATELRKVKAGLDALNPAIPEPPTRIVHPAP